MAVSNEQGVIVLEEVEVEVEVFFDQACGDFWRDMLSIKIQTQKVMSHDWMPMIPSVTCTVAV